MHATGVQVEVRANFFETFHITAVFSLVCLDFGWGFGQLASLVLLGRIVRKSATDNPPQKVQIPSPKLLGPLLQNVLSRRKVGETTQMNLRDQFGKASSDVFYLVLFLSVESKLVFFALLSPVCGWEQRIVLQKCHSTCLLPIVGERPISGHCAKQHEIVGKTSKCEQQKQKQTDENNGRQANTDECKLYN